jgi:hypothetical protein
MSPCENLDRLGSFGGGLAIAGFLDRVIRSNLSLPDPARIAFASGVSGSVGRWLSLMGYTLTPDTVETERDVLVAWGADLALRDAVGIARLASGGLCIMVLPGLHRIHPAMAGSTLFVLGDHLIHRLWSVAQDHGLDLLEAYGSLGGDPLTSSSEQAILVFAKTRS